MKKFFDFHVGLGLAGLLGSITLQNVNQAIACLVGLATLCYMLCKACREWFRLREEKKRFQKIR